MSHIDKVAYLLRQVHDKTGVWMDPADAHHVVLSQSPTHMEYPADYNWESEVEETDFSNDQVRVDPDTYDDSLYPTPA